MEAVILQNRVELYFDELQELGINAMEVSSTVLSLSIEEKVKFIERAKARGFTVGKNSSAPAVRRGGWPQTR
jgi:phosphosulfolactate synthase (CoM biosynthesis protein A)